MGGLVDEDLDNVELRGVVGAFRAGSAQYHCDEAETVLDGFARAVAQSRGADQHRDQAGSATVDVEQDMLAGLALELAL